MKFCSAYFLKTTFFLCCLFITCEELQSQTLPGPVGIGTTQPSELLHIKDGSMLLEGSNQYINFAAKPPHKTGLRFLNGDGQVSGTWSYNAGDQAVNLSSNDQVLGLLYNFNTDFTSIGRRNQIGENEKFGLSINAPKPEFGGMNIDMSGHDDHMPYYGYATQGRQQAIHYYDGASKSWKLRIGKDIMAATADGRIGIGTNSPEAKLHINGPYSDLTTSEGLLTLGGSTNRISFGTTSSGNGQIYSKSNSGMLVLGGNNNDVLFVDGVRKRIGIGVSHPHYATLGIASEEVYAARVVNNRSGTNTKVGARLIASTEGTGSKYAIQAFAYANDLQSYDVYGGKIEGIGGQGSGRVFGLYAQAQGNGSGNKYAIYTEAATTNPGPNSKSWALYSKGNSYFSDEVRIGTKNGATGYKLSVDGKIMCEDLKMQTSGAWPDYVFQEDYKLKPLKEVEAFVKENNHLPGVPSANEIKDQGGYEQGEMNRILLEKVEELTLYLIDQQNVLGQQNEKIAALEAELKKQSE